LNAAPWTTPLANTVAVARAGTIEPGTTQRVVVEDVAILLCNVGGTLYAIEDVCTHDGAPLDQGALDGRRITCPRHGAVFDVITGAVLALPAVLPVRTFVVNVTGDDVYIELFDDLADASTDIEHEHPAREHAPPKRSGPSTSESPLSIEGMDAYDQTLADSFPASDPPPGPLQI
jgi:3-phenylpropionate/trans-cinnamate dioxygenase ferredoxin component